MQAQTPAGAEVPVSVSAPAAADRPEADAAQIQRVLDNYRRLLELPQAPAARAETQRRVADLLLELDEAGGGSFEESERRLRESASLYEALLVGRPADLANDRVLYQLSRAYQNLGELPKAESVLARLARDYPASAYSDDAHFRRAELLFRLNQHEAASEEYWRVLERKQASPFTEPAQYKLAWAQYKLGHFAQSLEMFLNVLDRELPPGELSEPQAAMEGVRPGKKDLVKDALRVASLSFDSLGGGEGAAKFFAARPEPVYAPLLYVALSDSLLEKERYTDAAISYLAFVRTHPLHALAPVFQNRAIAAFNTGGFTEPVVQEKERYVDLYDPAAPYWTGRSASREALTSLRTHLEDVARYYQARGQKNRGVTDGVSARSDFQRAAARYQHLLELFPEDPDAAELRFRLAECYLDSGETLKAAREYDRVAAGYPAFTKSPDAAYAAVIAYYRNSAEAPAAQKALALRESVQAGLRLADRHSQHPQTMTVLTRAAEDLYQQQGYDEAIEVATRVLNTSPVASEDLRRTAWGVTADAQFSQKRYAEAERAYTELLKLTPAKSEGRRALTERLASSIYKQGEAARAGGDTASATKSFLRVGESAPQASIRATSVYDAAAVLISQKDWNQAVLVLESFRSSFPGDALAPDVDKKLAAVYQNAGRKPEAAGALKRVAARTTETAETRQDAAWLAVTLLDESRDTRAAADFEAYLKQYPQPLDRAMRVRQRLVELSAARSDSSKRQYWMREIVRVDAAAGAGRTALSRSLAAHAALEFARTDTAAAAKIQLKLPLKTSLPVKKQAMERAITGLTQAADYGIAEVTSAATFQLGELYRDFAKAVLSSERPKKLSALEREQYQVQLEERAFPFEEKAIQWHETNLQRPTQGVNDEWVAKSLGVLAEISPGRFGKREQTATIYVALLSSSTSPPPVDGVQERYLRALEHMKARRWQEAEAELTACLNERGQDPALHTNLGILYAQTQRKDQAAIAFTLAVAADPKNVVAHNWLGWLSRDAGHFPAAEKSYRQALEADPASADAHMNLAILYDRHLQRPQDALQEYRLYREHGGGTDPRSAVWIAELERSLSSTSAASGLSPGKPVTAPDNPIAPLDTNGT